VFSIVANNLVVVLLENEEMDRLFVCSSRPELNA